MPIEQELESIAERIRAGEEGRRQLAARLRFNSGKVRYPETLEEQLCLPVEKAPAEGKVAAVDAGIAGQELHGFDFLLMRTVGVLFEYKGSKAISHKYFPSAMPRMEYDARSGLDSYDVTWHKSLFRLQGELTAAKKLIEAHSPDYLLLDGSIAPLLSDKPPEDSEMKPLYDSVVDAYRGLYQSADAGNCALLGVIKDSRSKRFIEILAKHAHIQESRGSPISPAGLENESGFSHTTDTAFLFHLLQAGERTCAFSYSGSPQKHQILKDLGMWSEKILSFYLKPVKDDRPLRVEFLSGQKTFGQIASFVQSLSCLHKAYAYPAVLIEADLRAALSEDDFERAYSRLYSRLGFNSSLMQLRRNSRPFR